MSTLSGQAIDRELMGLLETEFQAQVISQFAHALNLRLESGQLISLLTNCAEPVPNGLILVDEKLPKHDFVNQILTGRGLNWQIDGYEIDLTAVEAFDCRISKVATTTNLQPRLNWLENWLSANLEPATDPLDSSAQKLINDLSRQLSDYWLSGRVGNVSQLIGLGSGLTPSGDDWLIGNLAILGTHQISQNLAKKIADSIISPDALSRTTDVSQHYLLAAAGHRFGLNLVNLTQRLLANLWDQKQAEQLATKVLARGATSGRDTLLGVRFGLSIIIKLQRGLL